MLTFRYGTHVGQKLRESYSELIRKFTKFREDLSIDNNFDLSQIANIDEIPLFINIPNTKWLLKLEQKKLILKPMSKKGFT